MNQLIVLLRRYPKTAALLAYAILFLPLYLPLLTGQQIYAAGDTLGFDYPPLRALQPFSLNGLLSDPFSGRGFPWLITYGTLDPIAHVLRLFLNEFQTLAWLCFLSFVFGAWFFALFLRRWSHSWIAAFIGGLIYSSAYFWYGDGDTPLALSLPLFGMLLLALTYARSRPWLTTGLVTIIVFYGWVAGHFNYMPLILIGCGCYALYHTVRGAGPFTHRARPLIAIVLGTFLGTGLGLIKLIPTLAYIQLSERAGGLAVSAASRGTIGLSFLYTAFFPYLKFPLLPGDTGGLFFGAFAVGLFLIACFQWRTFRGLLGAILIVFVIAMPHSPLYWLLQHIPFLSFLRGQTRWLFLSNACIAAVCAGSADRVLARMWSPARRMAGWILLLIGGVFLVISVLLTLTALVYSGPIVQFAISYFDAHLLQYTSHLPLEHYHQYIVTLWEDIVASLSLLSPQFLFPLLGVLAVGIAFHQFERLAQRVSAAAILLALVIGTALPPLFFYHEKTSPLPIQAIAKEYKALGSAVVMPVMPAFTDFLLRPADHPDAASERLRYQMSLLVPNVQALIGVRSIDFYQPLQPTRMSRLLAPLGSEAAPAPDSERLSLQKMPLADRLALLAKRMPLIELLNVQYVVSALDLPQPFRHVSNFVPVAGLPPVKIYRVPEPRPLLYQPRRVTAFAPDENRVIEALTALKDITLSTMECTVCPALTGGTGEHISYVVDADRSLTFTVTMDRAGWIVVSKPRIPGWRVMVDGQLQKTAMANSMFFGVPLEAGVHTVSLQITYSTLFMDSLRSLSTKHDPWLL